LLRLPQPLDLVCFALIVLLLPVVKEQLVAVEFIAAGLQQCHDEKCAHIYVGGSGRDIELLS
jgi:hypothetical protein